MAKQITTTTATPIRITAEHYQLESQSAQRAGKVYDLFFNREARRWECNCPDARPEKGNNPNCKHVRCLRAWINEQMNSSQAQREASEIIQRAPLAAEPLPSLIEEKIAGMELALAQQAEMIVALREELKRLQVCKDALVFEVIRLQEAKLDKSDKQAEMQELVSILQTQQCKTNEHRFQLEDKVSALQAEVQRLQTGNDALVYEVLRLQVVKHGKGDVTQETSEAHADRIAWEEFEKDPEAGRAKQAEKIRQAALNRGNDGFSLLRK